MSYWGSPCIAHTILELGLHRRAAAGGVHRDAAGADESYSALRGFFREYEICYVAADERDLIRLRTNYRGEDVYLYRLRTPLDRARALLLDYVKSMNELRDQPPGTTR